MTTKTTQQTTSTDLKHTETKTEMTALVRFFSPFFLLGGVSPALCLQFFTKFLLFFLLWVLFLNPQHAKITARMLANRKTNDYIYECNNNNIINQKRRLTTIKLFIGPQNTKERMCSEKHETVIWITNKHMTTLITKRYKKDKDE